MFGAQETPVKKSAAASKVGGANPMSHKKSFDAGSGF
jgi:hypothetical protein